MDDWPAASHARVVGLSKHATGGRPLEVRPKGCSINISLLQMQPQPGQALCQPVPAVPDRQTLWPFHLQTRIASERGFGAVFLTTGSRHDDPSPSKIGSSWVPLHPRYVELRFTTDGKTQPP